MDCLGPALSWLADAVGGLASTAPSPEPAPLRGTAADTPPDTYSSTPAATSLMSRMVARGHGLADTYMELEHALSLVIDVVESCFDLHVDEREFSCASMQPVTNPVPPLLQSELIESSPCYAPCLRRSRRTKPRRRRFNPRRPCPPFPIDSLQSPTVNNRQSTYQSTVNSQLASENCASEQPVTVSASEKCASEQPVTVSASENCASEQPVTVSASENCASEQPVIALEDCASEQQTVTASEDCASEQQTVPEDCASDEQVPQGCVTGEPVLDKIQPTLDNG